MKLKEKYIKRLIRQEEESQEYFLSRINKFMKSLNQSERQVKKLNDRIRGSDEK